MKFFNIISQISAHSAIIISGMMIVFFFIDRVNSAMEFINNDITKCLLLFLSIISIANSVIIICRYRKTQRDLNDKN